MNLSVIIPTKGRDTLSRTLESAQGADEIIVIENPKAPWGHASRDEGIAKATGDWILFMDDDDVFAPGAIDMVREKLKPRARFLRKPSPPGMHIFRMSWSNGALVWRKKVVRFGNIGTPMLVVPNRPDLPKWADHLVYEADFHFARACRNLLGEPTWHEEIIALIRPQ